MWEDRDFANYIVGQTDADSCFYLSVRIQNSRAVPTKIPKVRVEPTWAIGKAFDYEILKQIRDFLGVGNVHGPSPSLLRRSSKPMFRFAVNGKECSKVVEFFDRFPLRANKRRDFELWRKGVKIYCSTPRTKWSTWTKEELLEMIDIRRQMDTLDRAKKGRKQGYAKAIDILESQ